MLDALSTSNSIHKVFNGLLGLGMLGRLPLLIGVEFQCQVDAIKIDLQRLILCPVKGYVQLFDKKVLNEDGKGWRVDCLFFKFKIIALDTMPTGNLDFDLAIAVNGEVLPQLLSRRCSTDKTTRFESQFI